MHSQLKKQPGGVEDPLPLPTPFIAIKTLPRLANSRINVRGRMTALCLFVQSLDRLMESIGRHLRTHHCLFALVNEETFNTQMDLRLASSRFYHRASFSFNKFRFVHKFQFPVSPNHLLLCSDIRSKGFPVRN